MPLIRSKPDPGSPKPSGPNDLAQDISSGSADRRWAAARASASDPSNVPLLAAALARETDERVREAMFSALARISTRESVDVILSYLRVDDAAVRTAAMDALRVISNEAASHLTALLTDPDPDVRLLVCDLMRNLRDKEAVHALCELIETDSEANVCGVAVEVLAEIGDQSTLPSLSRCAARFPHDPFLAFAVETAASRLRTASRRV